MGKSRKGASSATTGDMAAPAAQIGVFATTPGAAAGPLAFLWSPAAACSIFLGIALVAATLGLAGIRFGAPEDVTGT